MKNSITYFRVATAILLMIAYTSFTQADNDDYEHHDHDHDHHDHDHDHDMYGHAMQQPYGQPGMQPYGMQQPYGHLGMQPYGMQQPYGQQGIQPYGMQQPYGHPGMQPYGMQQHQGQSGHGTMDKDHIKDQVKAQFHMSNPHASHDQWEHYWDNYKKQRGMH